MRLAYWYVLLFIPIILYLFFRKRRRSSLKFSNVTLLKKQATKNKIFYQIGRYLVLAGVLSFLIALARPQISKDIIPARKDGIDIALLLDLSGSMESVDFKPNRLEVAKKTTVDFVNERPGDRMALIAFAGNAYTRIPLTLDHQMVTTSIESLTTKDMVEQGTAIGMAISVGMNRLKKSEASSKIMILVTDGDNTAGSIDPKTASQLAKELGIKIYTIGVGTDRTIIPYNDFGITRYRQIEGGLDEVLLKYIAQTTGGAYYRATNEKALSQIFNEINQYEKTDFEYKSLRDYTELGYGFMLVGLILIAIGLFLDRYYYIKIP